MGDLDNFSDEKCPNFSDGEKLVVEFIDPDIAKSPTKKPKEEKKPTQLQISQPVCIASLLKDEDESSTILPGTNSQFYKYINEYAKQITIERDVMKSQDFNFR